MPLKDTDITGKAAPARWPALIFDLDGTLVDSAPQITESLNYALSKVKRPSLDQATVISMIGDGVPTLTARAFAATGGRNSKEETNAITEFHHHYQQTGHTSKAYPRVVETLEALHGAGYRLGLCTNKSMAGTELVLKTLGIAVFFSAVIAGDTLPTRKPHPEPLLEAIRQLGYEARQAIYIGDGPVDVATAKAASVRMIAVSYGYPRMPPEDLGADYLINDMADLPALLATLNNFRSNSQAPLGTA